jgi:hypothetical protein
MSAARLLCAFAVLMDAVLVVLMQALSLSAASLLAVLLAHAALCLLFARVLVRLLPEPLNKPAFDAGLFVFLGVVFIPVLGMGGFLVFVLPALRRQGLRVHASGWQHTDAPGLPDKPAQPQDRGDLSRSCDLAGPLLHAADPARRIAALIATLSLPSRQAVPLLRLALKDPDDEVRLLAYALLNRKEKAVEARMRGQAAPAAGDAPERVFLRHQALAHDYWELAHLGDPQGEALLSLCTRAYEHVQAALQLRPQEGGLHFLSGQILLAQRALEAASSAFEQAVKCGIDARQVCALQAEIAFKRQRYGDVGRHLKRLGGSGQHLQLGKLSRYWAGVGA